MYRYHGARGQPEAGKRGRLGRDSPAEKGISVTDGAVNQCTWAVRLTFRYRSGPASLSCIGAKYRRGSQEEESSGGGELPIEFSNTSLPVFGHHYRYYDSTIDAAVP